MLRKCLVALAMLVLCFTFVAADTIKGKITKIDDKSVTVANKKDKDGKAYDLAKDCKFYTQKGDAKEEIKDGAKADVFKNISDKGIGGVTITTGTDGKVTEVIIAKKK